MKILCIDDTNRPAEIPLNKWIVKGQEYTPLRTLKCNAQGGVIGYILAEIDLSDCQPYQCFSIHRFAIPVEIKEKVEELEEVLV